MSKGKSTLFAGLLTIAIFLGLLFAVGIIMADGPSRGKDNIDIHTNFIKIEEQENLYYDADTMIVYVIFNEQYGYKGYGYMSPYYAENGKPYKFDLSLREPVEIP